YSMKRNVWMKMAFILISVFMIAGCNGKQEPDVANQTEEPKPTPTKNEAPLTLRMLRHGPALSEEEFQKLFAEPVKKAYPHITLEFVQGANTGAQSPEALLASNSFPDLVFSSSRTFGQ